MSAQIRVEMAERDLTQAELAEKVGIARETLGRYMNGKLIMPLATLFALATVFDQSPAEFMAAIEVRKNG